MTNRTCGVLVMALAVVSASIFSMVAIAQQKPAPAKTDRAVTDLLPMTCAQAWVKSNKSVPKLLPIVKTLARVSLANRELTLPNTREAGLDAGKGIAEDCKADPNALLFAIVDKHVRRVAETATAAVN